MDLSMLNREQRIAAETIDGPLLILAGAGSGKTRALTYRLANMIDQGIPAYSILALTFTNKAAKEMKDRVVKLVGMQAANDAWISTFHSSCARILRQHIDKLGYNRFFTIYDDDDQGKLLKEIYKTLNIDDKYLPFREIRAKIGDAKNRLLSPDEWFSRSGRDHRCSMIHDVMTEYETKMKSLNALDFDDLLLKTLELFSEHPPVLEAYRRRFQYVMVDEYQDTNLAQYELVRTLTAASRNLCVVGDDDQSIYGWRGADLRNILDFEKDYPDAKVIKMERNYRSTANILDAANQVIVHNHERKDKKLWTEQGEGDRIQVYYAEDEHDESAWIVSRIISLSGSGDGYRHHAILYRANAQSRVLEESLMKSGIPYRIFGGQKFYERKEIKDILAYLRVIANPSDDISLTRIINVPKRAIGETTVQKLAAHAAEKGIPLFSALLSLPDGISSRAKNSISDFFRMMTLFSAMKDNMGVEEFVETLIEKAGLEEQYVLENTDEARDRLENIAEFRNSLHEFAANTKDATLEDYLENVALVTDLDRSEENTGFVTLMTLHSAKGLEFDNVFIPGLEENVFPSMRSVEDENRLEEERRLMYVGITRARKRLFLTYTSERLTFNQYNHNEPSRFLEEIPGRLLSRSSYRKKEQVRTGQNSFTNHSCARPASVRDYTEIGRPNLTYKGKSLDQIPGVSKGFIPSPARSNEDAAFHALFAAGDRVRHPKFGSGTVTSVTGSGKDTQIHISFDENGEKDFVLAIAPIVRVEE